MRRASIRGMLIIKEGEDPIRRDIKLTYDDAHGGSFQVEVIGDSPLKGYQFIVRQKDLKDTRDAGTPE